MPAAPPATLAPPPTGAVTPGTYLRRRREVAGITLDQVARFTRTDPAVEHRQRVEWLLEIEADQRGLVPADAPLLTMLGAIFPFDRRALAQLVMIQAGADEAHPQLCRLCLCGWSDACITDGKPCGWATRDVSICTACEARMALAEAAAPVPAEDVAA